MRGESSHRVSVRPFPFPYRAMLAISSDVDLMSIERFREVHRFLNTREETSMGTGVGLDVADSLWFYRRPSTSVSEQRPMAYFEGLDWSKPSPLAREILHYVRAGWIDSLHTYGNFSRFGDSVVHCTRRHAEEALGLLKREGLRLQIWINHGDRENVQNIGSFQYMQGDVRGSDAYHVDLLRDAGFRFFWSGGNSSVFGEGTKLRPKALRDESQVWRFTRFSHLPFEEALASGLLPSVAGQLRRRAELAALWHPQHLHVQLSERNLALLVENGHFAIVAQHLGSAQPLVRLGAPAVEALRRLAAAQEAGEILVARTERLLQYNLMRDHVRYETATDDAGTVIDVVGINDPAFGFHVPERDDVRGLTFDVADPDRTRIHLSGEPVPEGLIRRSHVPGGGGAVGIAWFEPDYADNTASFSTPADTTSLEQLNIRIAAFLDTQKDACPEGVTKHAFDYALRYTKGRYDLGLERYARIFRLLGFDGLDSGLDVGSGAGHWCLAFLHTNRSAAGIEPKPEFVELAERVAVQAGVGDRVRFHAGYGESLPFPDSSFAAAWSHGVLMFADLELALAEIARVVRPGGHVYCGYSSFGFRLEALLWRLESGELPAVKGQIANLMGDRLMRCGLHRNTWSNTSALNLDELLLAASVFGMTYVDQPDLQEGNRRFLGYPATIDVLLSRDDVSEERELGEHLSIGEVERLIEVGCGRAAAAVLERRRQDQDDSTLRSLHLRALIKAGRFGEPVAEELDRVEENPRNRGLFLYQRGNLQGALDLYRAVPDDDPQKAFLSACALLALGQDDEAADWIERGVEDPRSELACRVARLELAARREDVPRLKKDCAAFVRFLAQRSSAEEEAEEIASTLEPGVAARA